MSAAAVEAGQGPTRQCAVTRKRAEKRSLVRLALDPDGRPFVDVRGLAPGRGVYVSPEELREALSQRGLQRVFRGRARVLAAEEVEGLLADAQARMEQRLLELLGLARRTGQLALGMEATLAEIARRPREVVVLSATDLSARSAARVAEALDAAPEARAVRASTVAALGRALGRDVVGVIAVWHPKIGASVLDEGARIEALSGTGAVTRKND